MALPISSNLSQAARRAYACLRSYCGAFLWGRHRRRCSICPMPVSRPAPQLSSFVDCSVAVLPAAGRVVLARGECGRALFKQKWNRSAAVAALLAALVFPAPQAGAELISGIDGTIPPPPPGSAVSVTPGGPAGAVGNVLSEILRGSSILFNDAPIFGGDVPTLIISSQTITAVASVAGVTTYTLATDPQDTSFKELLFNAAQGGGAAIFDPIFSEAVVDDSAVDMLILRGTETVGFNSNPMFDFSPLEDGFITVSLNGPPGTDFNALLSSDDFQNVTVVGTFSQFTVVAEPGTGVLLGMGLSLLLGAFYRTRRLAAAGTGRRPLLDATGAPAASARARYETLAGRPPVAALGSC